MTTEESSAVVEFWEDRYASKPQVWSGRPNSVLVELIQDVPPGRALDLGCGEGGDAIWLAEHGWRVSALDISTTALERGDRAAVDRGVADQIDWQQQDLAKWLPEGEYDLVCGFFLQSPVDLPRAEIVRRAASAVAPGGRLLLVSHAAPPPWATQLHDHAPDSFPTPDGELRAAGITEADWRVPLAAVRQRAVTSPDGDPAVLDDCVVLAQRLPGGDRSTAVGQS